MSDKHYTADDADPAGTTRPEVRQEPDDVPSRPVLLAGAAIVVIGGVLVAAMAVLLRRDEAAIRPTRDFPEASPTSIIGPPREHPKLREGLFEVDHRGETLVAAQRASLDEWGWVDRAQGTVHLPIELAMEVVARRAGEASTGAATAQPTAPTTPPAPPPSPSPPTGATPPAPARAPAGTTPATRRTP